MLPMRLLISATPLKLHVRNAAPPGQNVLSIRIFSRWYHTVDQRYTALPLPKEPPRPQSGEERAVEIAVKVFVSTAIGIFWLSVESKMLSPEERKRVAERRKQMAQDSANKGAPSSPKPTAQARSGEREEPVTRVA
ncbi:hypothetical protein PG985_010330 [Apiospora marii]|uniref:Uncharacterized protein n=1 Tax=Apiospora marii TaxID=335849 RepID=A0ABR1RNN6_9PEZI